MTAAATDAIAILRIEIEDIEPLIWRRVAVRTSLNLKALHKVVQASMGWLDYHLWEFTADGRKYGILIPDDPDWNRRINNAASTKLSALLTTGVTGLGYVYDFGDDWKHRIIVEDIKPAEAGASYPRFLGGERRCPPEDCGGLPGYFEFIENIASKRSKKAKDALEWYGSPYDPDDIDEQQIKITLGRIANSYRTGRSKTVKT
jgi:hypothetical protein